MNLNAGDIVCRGKYRLLRVLGTGGFAQVFEAENLATKRRFALKVVHGKTAGTEVVERLRREAVVSSRVRHQHVVDVYDLEEEGDCWFLVMEYVHGETLRQALDRTRLSVDVVTSLLISVMRGLSVMHQHGVVHRDIKPDNIYLARQHDTTQVVAKLLDFGICKIEQPDPELPPLTRAGTQGMGTLLYMSPEQYADSAGVDARSDIYAIGVVLYECLTGQPPYHAVGQRDLMLKILTSNPQPPHALRPDIPPQLSAVVVKAMARDVSERYQSIAELIEALAPFGAESSLDMYTVPDARSSQPPSAAPPRRQSAWLAVLSALLVAQVVGIYWAVTSYRSDQPGATWLSPNGNVLAGFFLPPAMTVSRALARHDRASGGNVPVQVFCEAPGTELYVNGERVGAVVSSGPIRLSLPPGLYRFEALRNGSVVASDTQRVESGAPFELHLRLPRGTLEAPAPKLAQAMNAPAALVSTAPRNVPSDETPAPEAGTALSRDQLSDVIQAHQTELQRCYEQSLQGQPAPEEPVTIELELGIATTGDVTFVHTHGSTAPGLAECFDHSAHRWLFPSAGQATQLRFPLVFRRAQGTQLTSAQLSAVVARSKGMLQRCYADGRYGEQVLRLDVDMEVLPSGAVSSVAIDGDHPEIGACIARIVRLWQFPAAGEPTRTHFPVLLMPGV